MATRSKKTINKARSLLTGLNKMKKMSSKGGTQINAKNSAAIPNRHSDSIALMLAAVAMASPDMMILLRTNTSAKMPKPMMMRYNTPPILERTWGEVSTVRSVMRR